MAYSTANVTAYCDTGFSVNNVPATATVLQNSAQSIVDLGTINCLPLVGKKQGVITVTDFNGLSQCDYMKIVFSDSPVVSYWHVIGYDYVAGDTVNVELLKDGWLTCGGTSVSSISGYVKRATRADDTYGKYNQSDPLLIPSQNLIFRSIDYLFKTQTTDTYNIVLSTINLYDLGNAQASDLGITYGDDTLGTDINVPELPAMRSTWHTDVYYTTNFKYRMPSVQCFNGDSAIIQEGIARCRKLGIEGGIIAIYAIPQDWFNLTYDTTTTGQNEVITKIEFLWNTQLTNAFFNFKNVNNKRALYGSFETIQLCAMASGEMVEYDIEDLFMSPISETEPVRIDIIADGRSHGKPAFYPHYYKGQYQRIEELLTSVRGLEWQNVPLVYTYASREGIDRIRFFEGKKIDAQNILERREIEDFFLPQEKAWQVGQQFGRLNILGGALNVGKTMTTDMPKFFAERAHESNEWARQRNFELKNFMIDTRVVAPEIHFAPTESVRDFISNGVVCAFVTPTDADVERFDKILTMYGYMDAGTALELSDLTAGKYFSYIEATGVSIQTSVPVNAEDKSAFAEQFNAGIRIWKQRPDFSLYNSSNRT